MTTPLNTETPSAPAEVDVDTLLSEFDKSGASAEAGAGNPVTVSPQPPPPAEIPESFTQRILRKAQEREARFRDVAQPKKNEQPEQNDRLSQLEDFAAGIETERAQQREKADAEKVFQQAAEVAAEVAPWLPPEMAKAWLLNEVSTDGYLAEAWNNRHASAEHALIADRRINRALQKLRSYAKALPDPKASNDRELVSVAVRGAATKPPAEKPPNYNGMSDAEFDREMRTKYGINTRLA